MALLDVNALVALAWDSHVHHAAMRRWFQEHASEGWQTCAITEAGFVRVCSNRRALPVAIGVGAARGVLLALRRVGKHAFLPNDVSILDADVPRISGHRQVTDALLLTLASRNNLRLVTFDAGLLALGEPECVQLLTR